jgi:hypothetical protein
MVVYLSCDLTANTTSSDTAATLQTLLRQEHEAIILYTLTGGWCWLEGKISNDTNIFTTLGAREAGDAISFLSGHSSRSEATQISITGSPGSSETPEDKGGLNGKQKIILFAFCGVWGVLAILLAMILAFGVIRARQNPESYGSRPQQGSQPAQTRVQGIARALLDTLPIVQYASKRGGDDGKDTSNGTKLQPRLGDNAQLDHQICSVCTEDFKDQDDIRVLPCKHGFHAKCVDQWLVERSSSCPLW